MQHPNLPIHPVLRRDRSPGVGAQRGMTLVEWMVSITIGLVLLAGLTTLIAQQSSTQAELERSSRQIENGRYAMQLLSEDLQMAGYYGEYSNVSALAVPGAMPDPCATAASDIEAAMVIPVQGYDSLTTGLPSCIAAANHVAGTDILVVRRADPAAVTTAAAAAGAGGQVYLQSGLASASVDFNKKMGTGTDAAGTTVFTLYKKDRATLALLRRFLVRIYFVSPCSVPVGSTCSSAADGGKPIPTLKVLELSASGNSTIMSTTPLVEGIENMQIDYGIDSTGDGAPDGSFVTGPALTDWPKVMALRIYLLARNSESSPGYADAKTYNLGLSGATTATGDGFKRHVFSQLIRLVNPSSRRDQ